MITFQDYYQNQVRLSFEDHPFSDDPKHVWVICRYQGQWLLTQHKERGIEFPGGKVEEGESAKEAAVREVDEETGGQIESIYYIGQYFVDGKGGEVIKNIYFANIKELTKHPHFFETRGPVLLEKLPSAIHGKDEYSFMMKDHVLVKSLEFIQKQDYFH